MLQTVAYPEGFRQCHFFCTNIFIKQGENTDPLGSLSFSRILFRRIQFVAIYVVIFHFVAR